MQAKLPPGLFLSFLLKTVQLTQYLLKGKGVLPQLVALLPLWVEYLNATLRVTFVTTRDGHEPPVLHFVLVHSLDVQVFPKCLAFPPLSSGLLIAGTN